MYIADVIPLTMLPRGQQQIISYYSAKSLERGAVVSVPFNHRQIKAVVIDCGSIKQRKLVFKKNVSFSLKNVEKILSEEPQVSETQLKITDCISSNYYSPLGLTLKTILPPFWGKKKYILQVPNNKLQISNKIQNPNFKNTIEDYEKLVTKNIEAGKQVFLMVPENVSAKYFIEKFSDLNPLSVSSGLKNKEYFDVWQKTVSGEAKLIIGTRVGLFLPFKNLGLIIVDDESNEAYKSDMTPRYNAADLAKEIANIYGAGLVYNAIFPRIETYYDLKPTISTPKAKIFVENMISEIKNANFSIFSRRLKDDLKKLVTDGGRILLYIPRRGFSNFILCEHCGQILKCPNCSASLVIHESTQSASTLICHHCSYSTTRPKACPACASYKLKAFGIGIEKVIKELDVFFKRAELKMPPIYRMDSDSVKDETEEEEIIKKFQTEPSAILVATQMLFTHKYYLADENNLPILAKTVIINADTLFSIPDFRAEESQFRQMFILATLTGKLIIQTHNPEAPAIKDILSGNTTNFCGNEIKNRKVFGYPPFSSLIKLTYRHPDSLRSARESKMLAEKLFQQATYLGIAENIRMAGPTAAFISKEKNNYVWNIILKCKDLENKTRNELLRVVPAGWVVDVDPRTVM